MVWCVLAILVSMLIIVFTNFWYQKYLFKKLCYSFEEYMTNFITTYNVKDDIKDTYLDYFQKFDGKEEEYHVSTFNEEDREIY